MPKFVPKYKLYTLMFKHIKIEDKWAAPYTKWFLENSKDYLQA